MQNLTITRFHVIIITNQLRRFTMSFKAEDRSIYDLLNDKMYSIPNNQRKYVWNRQNWDELFNDVKLIVESKTSNHFLGSIVLIKENIEDGIKQHFCIIDGQQRISTLTIFLCAIGYHFVENGELDLFNGLTKNLLVWDDRKKPHPIVSENANREIGQLVTRLIEAVEMRTNNGACMSLMSPHELAMDASLSKKIEECFSFFYKALKDEIQFNKNCLVAYKETILAMRYIDVVADNHEDAYTVFEILNARGQPLTDFELLRNYFLKNVKAEEKVIVLEVLDAIESLLESSTELFLKHYITHRYGLKATKNDRPYKVIVGKEKSTDKIKLLNDIFKKAQYYNKIISYDDCNQFERKVFSYFKPRRQQQFRPIVLSLMHQRELKGVDENEYENALRFLYEFFIYFNVIGEQTSNKIEDIVYKYACEIENCFDDTTISMMKSSMSERIPSSIDSLKTSMKNIRYSSKWKVYSGSKKAENVRAILEIIEREHGYTGEFSPENFSIEHVYNDSDSENNSEIGNLILLETKLNEACKSKDIADKIDIYQKSNLYLPKEIDSSTFNMSERTERIIQSIYDIIKELKE